MIDQTAFGDGEFDIPMCLRKYHESYTRDIVVSEYPFSLTPARVEGVWKYCIGRRFAAYESHCDAGCPVCVLQRKQLDLLISEIGTIGEQPTLMTVKSIMMHLLSLLDEYGKMVKESELADDEYEWGLQFQRIRDIATVLDRIAMECMPLHLLTGTRMTHEVAHVTRVLPPHDRSYWWGWSRRNRGVKRYYDALDIM